MASERAKYSVKGGFTTRTFARLGLPTSVVIPLMEAANHSLAANSWTSYATAERHIARVREATGLRLQFPFSAKAMLTYVGFLLCPKAEGGRGLKGSSVEKYLSALRMIHMTKGYFNPWIRPEIVKQVTRGACNRDQLIKRMEGKTGRHAMTPDLMWSLKLGLSKSTLTRSRRRIIWAVSTICWAGALRIHEALARTADSYDPLTTMTVADVKLGVAEVRGVKMEILKVHLKHPKEERLSAGVNLDVFESKDFMCPVKAYKDCVQDKVVQEAPVGQILHRIYYIYINSATTWCDI